MHGPIDAKFIHKQIYKQSAFSSTTLSYQNALCNMSYNFYYSYSCPTYFDPRITIKGTIYIIYSRYRNLTVC